MMVVVMIMLVVVMMAVVIMVVVMVVVVVVMVFAMGGRRRGRAICGNEHAAREGHRQNQNLFHRSFLHFANFSHPRTAS